MTEEPPGSAMGRVAKKSGDPRKHHYVPVFYQEGFANDAGLLWVYDRNNGHIRNYTLFPFASRKTCMP
jgi:hypothetical protein